MSHADCVYLFLGFCLLLMPVVLTSGGVLCAVRGITALCRRQLRPAYLAAGLLMIVGGLILGWALLCCLPVRWTDALRLME